MLANKVKGLVVGAWAVALLLTPGAQAQTVGTTDKVPAAQLQNWLDDGFSYAGVHKASQCVVLNVAQGSGRTLFIRCPNGWAEKISGTARVVGETYCTSFPIPNTPPGEDCVSWHSLGQGRYEQRKGNDVDTTVILLPQGLAAVK